MSFIIYDEGDLCPRKPIFEEDVCARDIELLNDGEARNPIDVADMFTNIAGDGSLLTIYRADTTLVSADNVNLDASYHF